MKKDIYTTTYQIDCIYDKDSISLKELLEDMYLNYIENLKKN